MHGGDDGEVAAGGDLLKSVDDVLAYSFDVATGSLFVVRRDEGEEIVGGGGIAVCYLLHGSVPLDGDAGLVGDLRGIGERETLDVGFPDMGYVGETDAPTVDAEEEHITGEGHRFGIGEVSVAHAAEFVLREQFAFPLDGNGGLHAFQQAFFGNDTTVGRYIMEGVDLIQIETYGRFLTSVCHQPFLKPHHEIGRQCTEGHFLLTEVFGQTTECRDTAMRHIATSHCVIMCYGLTREYEEIIFHLHKYPMTYVLVDIIVKKKWFENQPNGI